MKWWDWFMGKRKGKKAKKSQRRKKNGNKWSKKSKKSKKNEGDDMSYWSDGHWSGGWGHTYSTGSNYVSKQGCHTGNPLVFTTDDGIEVYAGGTSRQGAWYRMDPYPDLAIGPRQVIGKSSSDATIAPEGFTCSQYIEAASVPKVLIDFPDYNIPQDIDRPFWVALVEDIRRLGFKRISTQCVGGHGRTGVQLAILAHLFGVTEQPDSASLIRWVRDRYCVHAVEAGSQQQYVADVCELPLGDDLFPPKKPSKPLTKTTLSPNTKTTGVTSTIVQSAMKVYPDDADFEHFKLYDCKECLYTEWIHIDDEADLGQACPECLSSDEWNHNPKYMEEHTEFCSGCDKNLPTLSFPVGEDHCRGCLATHMKDTVIASGKGYEEIECAECDNLKPVWFFGNDRANEWDCITCIDSDSFSKRVAGVDEE